MLNHFTDLQKRCEKHVFSSYPLQRQQLITPKAKELAKISEILDSNKSIYDLVLQDLVCTESKCLVFEKITIYQLIKHRFSRVALR